MTVIVALAQLAAAAPLMAAFGVTASTFVAANYSSQISLGAIVISAAVGVMTLIALLFGVRYRENNKLLTIERTAQEERGNRLQSELDEHRAAHEEYRERKHAVITDLSARCASLQAELELESAKHDYTALSAQIAGLTNELAGRTDLFAQLIKAQRQTTDVLAKVAAALDIALDKANGGDTHATQ